ncbi:MAG: cytochrome c biosis protein CcmG, thiol:disulfide interchange protein DsbE [Sphingomonadales bacterium]|jgi:cytochrome c biogenesis protein CcmG/thiol:disulfide interchange protein DsbE|nr:cytochrome c biosis protein CcmG, thiol:disulfide interchange protein DsbE [Sphingomonadales bacterium]
MRKHLILWVPFAGLAILVAMFKISLNSPRTKEIPTGLIGQAVPEFTLAPAIAERPGLSAASLRGGRPHIVNVFASWCLPCQVEAPQLEALSRRGMNVVGIAIRDRPEDLARFFANFGNPFSAIGADVDRSVQMNMGSAGVPETFVVDGRGVIRLQHIGAITEADMPKLVAAYEAAR